MYEIPKVRAIAEAWQNSNPDRAADQAAERFERLAITVPESLTPRDDAPAWERKVYGDAAELYRSVVMAGETGVRLADLRAGMGKDRATAALKLLRGADVVSESLQVLPDAAGRVREQIILHAPDDA